MAARFDTDPFYSLLSAYNRLHDGDILVQWVSGLRDEQGAWGRTHFDTEPVTIEIDGGCPVAGALDVLAHELAHCAAGFGADHGPEFTAAKAALMAEAFNYQT